MPTVKDSVVNTLPAPVFRRLWSLRRHGRRVRYLARERLRPVTLDRDDVAMAFARAGLPEGGGVFVHSAMSRFGRIEGGPATVLGALEDVLGPGGLIVMPAFPHIGSTYDHVRTDPHFDVRATSSRMGALTEHFRRLPGTLRSAHPTHSVCARGPGAAELLAGHEDALTPFGEGTPFARMVDAGMHQLWFGTGIQTFTMYYTFACLRGSAFPFELFLDQRFALRCRDADGREYVARTLVHDPEVAAHKESGRHAMRRHLLETGTMRAVALGRGEVLAAPLRPLMQELDVLLARGITVYDGDAPRRRS